MGGVSRLQGCLIESRSSGDSEVMLCICPLQYKEEGREGATSSPCSCRWLLCSVIMGPVAPSCLSAHIRDKTQSGLICPCVSIYLNMYICVHTHSCAPIDIGSSFPLYVIAQNHASVQCRDHSLFI